MQRLTITATLILVFILSTTAFAGSKEVAEYLKNDYEWLAPASKTAGGIGEIVITEASDGMHLRATNTEEDWIPAVYYPNGQARLQLDHPDPATILEHVLKQDGDGDEVECVAEQGTIDCPIPDGTNILHGTLYRRFNDGGFQPYNFLRKCTDRYHCAITGALYDQNAAGGGMMILDPTATEFGYGAYIDKLLAKKR
jgi:hypothetical protein